MTLILVNRSSVRMPRKFLQVLVKHCRSELRSKITADQRKLLRLELVVVFCDKSEAKKINTEFRGKNYATDVLSFSSAGLGELVLCPQVLSEQADRHGLSFKEELAYLVLHGILHLLGFEHEKSAAKARKMFALQDQLFGQLSKKRLA